MNTIKKIEAIVMAIFGALILTFAIILNAGWEIITLGALLLAVGIVFTLLVIFDNKEAK